MNTLTFKDGTVVKTELSIKEYLKRYNRLDILRILMEGYESGEGFSICYKAIKAQSKNNGFTGIIRLTFSEKDFLGYLEPESEEEKEILSYLALKDTSE